MHPLVLDLDGSVGPLPGAIRVPLQDWSDSLRFACSRRRLRRLGLHLADVLPARHDTVFFGSGDFHHLSLPLIERALARAGTARTRVLVFDNHPDNMRFPFGVHCGSWVSRVAAMPQVLSVDVVGITSGDIGLAHAWENRWWPLYRHRLRYWSIGVDTGWARHVGLSQSFNNFDSADALMAALLQDLDNSDADFYLSIDKDVLDPIDARSNWDQGILRVAHLQAAIHALSGKLLGSDVNGELSIPHYPQRWKRLLSAMDAQPLPDPGALAAMQEQQHVVNLALLTSLESCGATLLSDQ